MSAQDEDARSAERFAEQRRLDLLADVRMLQDYSAVVRRALHRLHPDEFGLSLETHERLAKCAESVHEGACRMRVLLEEASR